MIKPSIFILAAAILASPGLAQNADPAAPAATEAPAPAAAPVAAEAPAPAALPKCSARVQDACQQTSGQEARAISAAEADRRGKHADAPGTVAAAAPPADATAAKPMAHKKHGKHHKHHATTKVETTTQTTTEAAPAK